MSLNEIIKKFKERKKEIHTIENVLHDIIKTHKDESISVSFIEGDNEITDSSILCLTYKNGKIDPKYGIIMHDRRIDFSDITSISADDKQLYSNEALKNNLEITKEAKIINEVKPSLYSVLKDYVGKKVSIDYFNEASTLEEHKLRSATDIVGSVNESGLNFGQDGSFHLINFYAIGTNGKTNAVLRICDGDKVLYENKELKSKIIKS
jgi:hypothetical protein